MAFTVKQSGIGLTTWHLPDACPILEHLIGAVEWLQADGDELEQIRYKFSYGVAPMISTIPLPRGNIARWYGDLAKTILFSL